MNQSTPSETDPETTAERLSRRVEAARARAADRARSAASATGQAAGNAAQVVRDHPLLALGGAVVVGAVLAQALPGKLGKKARKRSRRAIGLAASAAELALAYGQRMSETAAEGGREGAGWVGHVVRGVVDNLGEQVANGTETARRSWFDLAGMSAEQARDVGNVAAKTLRKFAKRFES